MILRDDIVYHRKFLLAGQLIGGPGGAARALALWMAAIGYAREHLTDGFVDNAFIANFLLDTDARRVANALSSKRVRLLHKTKGGYLVHDFLDHNGTADKLRHQRELARERKRRQRAAQAVENARPPVENSESCHASRVTNRDIHASTDTDTDTEKEYVRTTERTGTLTVRSPSLRPVVPKREQQPAGCETAALELSEAQKTELTRQPADDGNYHVLVKLVHTVMDDQGTTDATSPTLIEAVKCAAAAHRIQYPHDALNRALRSAGHQRTPGPLQPLAESVRAAIDTRTLPQLLRTMTDTRQARRR